MTSCTRNREEAGSLFARLAEVLGDELTIAGELEQALEEKQAALVGCKVELLKSLAEHELRQAQRLRAVDGEREAIATELNGHNGGNGQKLGELVCLNGATQSRERLDALAVALKLKLTRLNQLNEDNRVLTQNLLDYTAMVMRLIAGGAESTGYSPDGTLNTEAVLRALVDDRI